MLKAMEKAGCETHSVENVSIHYGWTIKRGTTTGSANKDAVVTAYGERWFRIWHFFLAWSAIIAEQGNAACFQVVLNKNLDAFDRTRWVDKKSVVLGDRARTPPPQPPPSSGPTARNGIRSPRRSRRRARVPSRGTARTRPCGVPPEREPREREIGTSRSTAPSAGGAALTASSPPSAVRGTT